MKRSLQSLVFSSPIYFIESFNKYFSTSYIHVLNAYDHHYLYNIHKVSGRCKIPACICSQVPFIMICKSHKGSVHLLPRRKDQHSPLSLMYHFPIHKPNLWVMSLPHHQLLSFPHSLWEPMVVTLYISKAFYRVWHCSPIPILFSLLFSFALSSHI